MDQKKRNSILRTTVKDDEHTCDFNARLKRRISFSGRKSVRVFSHEEEPKTWNNSYDLSDRIESSTNSTKSITSNEIQAPLSSTLCTTSEFIDKLYEGDIFVENSLGITLTEYELKHIKQARQIPVRNADDTNLTLNDKLNYQNITSSKTLTHELENKAVEPSYHIPTQPASNSTATNFVYINENSNKENIAPEVYEILDADNSKKPKSTNMEQSPTNTNAHTSDGICSKNTKSPKVIVRRTCTIASSNQQKITLEDDIDRLDIPQNISEICPIPLSPCFMSNESTPNFCSPLIPIGSLPTCSKKLDFLQINEDIIKGRLKLFPNVEKVNATPKVNCLDITDSEVKNCDVDGKFGKERTTDFSKGAIPKNRPTIKDRTTYMQMSLESTHIDHCKDSEPRNRRTLYLNDCIESESTKTNPRTFASNMLEKGNCDLNKTEANSTVHIQQKSDNEFVDQSKYRASPMELLENSYDNFDNERETECNKNVKVNRRTIHFENEVVETEKLYNESTENAHQDNNTLNTENHLLSNCREKHRLEFLRTPSIEQMDIISTSNIEQDINFIGPKASPRKNRYTHLFDKSGVIDISSGSKEIKVISNVESSKHLTKSYSEDDVSMFEKSECVIPETQPMEFNEQAEPIEKIPSQNPEHRRTHYFNESEKINITNDISEIQDPKLFPSSAKKTHYFNNTEIMNISSEAQRDESMRMDTASGSKCNANPFEKAQYIDSKVKTIEKQFKKPNETRKTIYFSSDDSLNLTNTNNGMEQLNINNQRDESMLMDTASGNKYNANPFEKAQYIDSEVKTIEKQFKKPNEPRRTIYFGSDDSLNLTNTNNEQLNINNQSKPFEFEDIASNEPFETNTYTKIKAHFAEKSEKIRDKNSELLLTKDVSIKIRCPSTATGERIMPNNDENKYTHIVDNSNLMNVTKNQDVELPSINMVKSSLIRRHTYLFNDSEALITSIEEYNKKELQEHPEIPTYKQPTNRKTLHFENDGLMDITNEMKNVPIESRTHELKTHEKTHSSIETQTLDIELTNEVNMKFESNLKTTNRQKTVMFSLVPDEMEIETTPLRPLKTGIYARFNTFSPATPHRSIIEFLRLEREINEEQDAVDNTFVNESLKDTNTNTTTNQKRSPSNLTPNLPESKKWQSSSCSKSILKNSKDIHENVSELIADNPNLQDHSFMEGIVPIAGSQESYSNKSEESLRRPEENIDMEQTLTEENKENYSQNIHEPLTPSRTELRSSRIPIYTGSAKKKSITRISSPNMKSVLNLDFSQTVETARFAVSNEGHIRKRSVFEYEDNPITISDVSEHYLSQKQRRTMTIVAATGKSENKKDQLMESLLEIIDSDDIDKTKLELVDTLLDETDEEDSDEVHQQNNHNNFENIIPLIHSENVKQKDTYALREQSCKMSLPEGEDNLKNNSLLSRKCKRCQHSVLNETASTETNESFVMPPMPSISELRETFFKEMEKMKKGPTLAMANEFYERTMLKNSLESLDVSIDEDIEEDDTYEDPIIKEFKERSEQIERDLKAQFSKPVTVRKSFISRLKELVSGKNTRNWIMNAEMMQSQILKFRHKHTYTFCLTLQYKKEDPFGDDVVITDIWLADTSVPKRIWVPFDFMAHFQLQLELPSRLLSYCTGNSETNVYEMLIKIDEICKNVVQMSKEVWRIVVEKEANLIRENGQTIIRKVARKIINDSDGLYQNTEKTEFRIEVTNIKKLCFKDIIMPPVYMFREDIESLPAGLDFLNIFLNDPTKFLKSANI